MDYSAGKEFVLVIVFECWDLPLSGPIEAKFHMEPPWDGGMKVCSNVPGHITKMADMPIYVETLKNLLLRNRKADDL